MTVENVRDKFDKIRDARRVIKPRFRKKGTMLAIRHLKDLFTIILRNE